MTKCAFINYLVRRLRQLSKGMYKKATYVKVCKFMIQKEKSLFIPVKLHSITISSVIPYISEINSTSSSLNKKKKKNGKRMCKRKREKEREKKERKKECERKEEKDGKEKEKQREKKRE